MLMLLSALVLGAWADGASSFGGDGSAKNPYILNTATQWNEFASNVNGGNAYSGMYFVLGNDISVTTMVGAGSTGKNAKPFSGTFDGGGHTLTFTHTATAEEGDVAPFRFIRNATICNLHVAGEITTAYKHAGGLAGRTYGTSLIQNCRVSTVIKSSVAGDATHGGFVANCQNNADDATLVAFTRCVFDGKLLGTATDNCGGFVGWTAGNDWAGVKFIDCIFKPSELSVQSDGSATFSRGQNNYKDYITVENSYYIQRLGTMQGDLAYTEQPTDVTTEAMTIVGITVYVKKTVVNNLAASGITPTTATVSWTGTEACSNYQVRYRKKQDASYSTSFDDGLPEGWRTFDNDDDEHNWTYEDGTKEGMAHSGKGSMYSASYINNYGALEPDNWLVSPQLTLGGIMKVWLKGQDGDKFREHFAIYLSTTGSSKEDFLDASGNLKSGVITLVPETETTNEYQEYTAKLSTYGEQGYIAIRHFNCYDQFYLVLDDFSVSNANEGAWTTVSSGSPAGTTLTGLDDGTTYEYQIGFDYGGNTFYTSTATLSTLAADVAPTDLTATSTSATTATISWKGFGTSYNLRYSQGGLAKVTLSVPNDIWGDGSGYQMLLDKDHDTYGSVIPETGGLTGSGDASAETYAEFGYKMPTNADGALGTENIVDGSESKKSVTIEIPAGIYDWCITNPSPDDRVWIASGNGNVGGRQNDFTFEAGKHYTFTVTFDEGSSNDCVNMTVEDDNDLAQGDMTEITGITGTLYALSGLTASTHYTIFVQSVKGNKTSDWSSVNFTTLNAGELYLYDNQDNSTVLANSVNQTVNVTLQGRTLYKDGGWNTICLPFNVTLEGSPLEEADVRTLDNANLTDGTLTLNFTAENAVTTLVAGTPYIIKWAKVDGYDQASVETRDIKNPVFNGVTIDKTDRKFTSTDGKVEFKGNYNTQTFNATDKSILFMGSGNTLCYPESGASIGACRAYFHVDLIGQPNGVRAFVLNFGDEDDDATGISDFSENSENSDYSAGAWFDLNGRRLNGKPTAKGVYLQGGRKIMIK